MKSEMQKIYLSLLLIIAMGCLGALPIAPYLLKMPSNNVQVHKTSSPTYTEGQCTDSAITHSHFATTTAPASLPEAWQQAKRTHTNYVQALDCAATFVDTYESFDYRQTQSFAAALPLISAAAKQRYYQGYGKTPANIRTNARWQMLAKQWQIVQKARSSRPVLQSSKYDNGTLYIVLNVPYQLTQQMAGKNHSLRFSVTVLLKGIAPNNKNHGIGWQVSDWHENP
jgi:hypothetical protein